MFIFSFKTNIPTSKLDPQANQEELLKKAKLEVKNNAILMKKALVSQEK